MVKLQAGGRLLHLNVKDNQYAHKGDPPFGNYAVSVAEMEAALRSTFSAG